MTQPSAHVSTVMRAAIIGAGPSGFYAAEALFNAQGVEFSVDLFDRLPTPYGLVRGGVAPDHQSIKKVTRVYERIAGHERFRFFGNITLGKDIDISDLMAHYDVIVYAFGNESDKPLRVKGAGAAGMHSATEFVGWYNGHPDFVDAQFDLKCTSAAIIGMGNVAMDVARILAQKPDELRATDIASHTFPTLESSQITDIHIFARRGPAQAAFSPKEIKEVGKLAHADLIISEAGQVLDTFSAAYLEKHPDRNAAKNLKYLEEKGKEAPESKPRRVHLHFLRSPHEIRVDAAGRVQALRVEHTKMAAGKGDKPGLEMTGTYSDIPVGLLFTAIGYRGVKVEGVPFHEGWGIVPNDGGRVLQTADGQDYAPGQYVVGWAKRGPTGLIGTNKNDAVDTVKLLHDDYASSAPHRRQSEADFLEIMKSRGLRVVTFADWQRLDAEEIRRGEALGKIREKFTTIASMLEFLGSPNS